MKDNYTACGKAHRIALGAERMIVQRSFCGLAVGIGQ
jgi:hypothetical protein